MENRVAIVYSTIDGQTKKICKELVRSISPYCRVRMYPLEHFQNFLDFDTVVIGASVRYGKHSPVVGKFLQDHAAALAQRKTAFFSVNLVARKSDKDTAQTNPYLIKFLEETGFKFDLVDVFAGKLDYSLYSFLDKLLVKMIMKMTHGPTSTKVPIEYTDWVRVKAFGQAILDLQHSTKISAGIKACS